MIFPLGPSALPRDRSAKKIARNYDLDIDIIVLKPQFPGSLIEVRNRSLDGNAERSAQQGQQKHVLAGHNNHNNSPEISTHLRAAQKH
ncbi:MAG: hypothetical protein WB697_21265, partial [Stellaceae bacterium]